MDDAYSIVIPSLGRPSLRALLQSLGRATGPIADEIIVVDDRRERSSPLDLGVPRDSPIGIRTVVIAGHAAGPAAARNRGWRQARSAWIAFLDDDVEVDATWCADLFTDIAACDGATAGTKGRVRVPLDAGRSPTDWERNVRELEAAHFITADFAFRREVLERTGGFDERFPRAYREDVDFALRVLDVGWKLTTGRRVVSHAVRPVDRWISIRLQAGNADDALMRALHGDWHARGNAGRGLFRAHVTTVIAACAAAVGFAVFASRVLSLAWRRISPGPRDRREIVTMLLTSVVIPFAAVYHRIRGSLSRFELLRRPARRAVAVLFDRDGTLIHDDPALRDARDVLLVDGAREALSRLREAGIACGIVTNQPRIAEGTLSRDELEAIHARLANLAGPFEVIEACMHAEDAGCSCRKPQPGLVIAAARKMGVEPGDCVVVGDIGSDVQAAAAAGARAILVPTPHTLQREVTRAGTTAPDLRAAVDLILAGIV